MHQSVPHGPVIGFLGVLVVLGSVQRVVELGAAGWTVGLVSGAIINVLLARGLVSRGRVGLGPADRVTLTRAVLACGVAALTVTGFHRPVPLALLVALSSTALALDAVDGRVARRTGTASRLGARFDMETDAFLILVLSVHVSREFGWWVLAGGAARYALIVAAWGAAWLRRQMPPRRWRKVVAGLQGVALTVAAAQLLEPGLATTLLVAALALLASSFATEIASLCLTRPSRERDHVGGAAGWAEGGAFTAARVRGARWRT